jgi:uncharacterized pyridoxal phosphate-containing UPF0001 family protein
LQVNGEVIRRRLARVREKINWALERSGREAEGVRLLVASKYYAPEQISALAEAGVDLVGENRARNLSASRSCSATVLSGTLSATFSVARRRW